MRCNPGFTITPHNYDRIKHRVRALISDHKMQRVQFVTIRRLDKESPSDWQRLVDEIAETAGARVIALEDGAIRIFWNECCDF